MGRKHISWMYVICNIWRTLVGVVPKKCGFPGINDWPIKCWEGLHVRKIN